MLKGIVQPTANKTGRSMNTQEMLECPDCWALPLALQLAGDRCPLEHDCMLDSLVLGTVITKGPVRAGSHPW